MDRLRAPPLLLFAAMSLVAHVGIFGATAVHRSPPAPAFDPTSQPLTGETLDVDPPAPDPGTPEDSALTPTPAPAPAPAPAPTPAPAPHLSTTSSPSPSGGPSPSLFGAVGVRFATDLATSFTRGFPQAASADAIWSSAPLGSAGTADVTLQIDDAGRLTSSGIGGAPSPALRRGIERTLALLGPRTFVARGATTRLRVTARVGRDDVHDGLHGEVFALSGGSFTGATGTAFFALPSAAGGRRIDVELRLLP